MINHKVDFRIAKDQIPEVKINGVPVGVVTCSYQWVTRGSDNLTQCLLVVNGVLGSKKVDLMLNEITGEVFMQTYDCYEC